MNEITFSFSVIALLSFVIGGLLVKNYLLTSKIKLHREFVKRTNVKKFLFILEKTHWRVLDSSDISMMLDKYFELALNKLDAKWIPSLLADIQKSKHSEFLYKSFSRAAAKEACGLFGLALSANIENLESRGSIQSLLETFPEQEKKRQYQVALRFLKEDYDRRLIEYPSEYRKPTEEAMQEFKKIIA